VYIRRPALCTFSASFTDGVGGMTAAYPRGPPLLESARLLKRLLAVSDLLDGCVLAPHDPTPVAGAGIYSMVFRANVTIGPAVGDYASFAPLFASDSGTSLYTVQQSNPPVRSSVDGTHGTFYYSVPSHIVYYVTFNTSAHEGACINNMDMLLALGEMKHLGLGEAQAAAVQMAKQRLFDVDTDSAERGVLGAAVNAIALAQDELKSRDKAAADAEARAVVASAAARDLAAQVLASQAAERAEAANVAFAAAEEERTVAADEQRKAEAMAGTVHKEVIGAGKAAGAGETPAVTPSDAANAVPAAKPGGVKSVWERQLQASKDAAAAAAHSKDEAMAVPAAKPKAVKPAVPDAKPEAVKTAWERKLQESKHAAHARMVEKADAKSKADVVNEKHEAEAEAQKETWLKECEDQVDARSAAKAAVKAEAEKTIKAEADADAELEKEEPESGSEAEAVLDEKEPEAGAESGVAAGTIEEEVKGADEGYENADEDENDENTEQNAAALAKTEEEEESMREIQAYKVAQTLWDKRSTAVIAEKKALQRINETEEEASQELGSAQAKFAELAANDDETTALESPDPDHMTPMQTAVAALDSTSITHDLLARQLHEKQRAYEALKDSRADEVISSLLDAGWFHSPSSLDKDGSDPLELDQSLQVKQEKLQEFEDGITDSEGVIASLKAQFEEGAEDADDAQTLKFNETVLRNRLIPDRNDCLIELAEKKNGVEFLKMLWQTGYKFLEDAEGQADAVGGGPADEIEAAAEAAADTD